MSDEKKNKGRRTEYAPTAGGGGTDASSSVISVALDEDEEVRWCWTHFPDGSSAVTGYDIVEVENETEHKDFTFEGAVANLLWPEKRIEANKSLNRMRRPIGF